MSPRRHSEGARSGTRAVAALAATLVLLASGSASARGPAPSLELNPDLGPAGLTIAASGGGFADACGVRITWDGLVDGQVLAHAQVGTGGGFSTEIVIPPGAGTGDHLVYAQGLSRDSNGRCAAAAGPDGPLASQFFDVTAPPPRPVADLELSKSTAKPGEVVLLDAQGSSGDLQLIAFDLDGNGSYESKCGGGAAGVVTGKQGTKTVGVQVTSSDGEKATGQQTLTIAGSPAPPPPKPGGGTFKPLKEGTVTGVCDPVGDAEALVKAYQCPTTVKVGVAEAVIPPDLPGDPCFERKHPGAKLAFFRAQSKEVLLNGLRMKTLKSTSRLAILEQLKRVEVHGPVGKDDTTFKVTKPGYSSAITSGVFDPSWDVSKAGKVGTVPIAQPLGLGQFLGLPYSSKSTDLRLTAAGGARFNLYLELPLPKLLFKSLASSKPLEVRTSNTEGIDVSGGYTIGINDVFVGLFTLKKIAVSYERQGGSNVWSGEFDLEFPSSGVAADGQVTVRDGVLESLTAAVNPGPPGIGPIGCCVWIVGFDGTLTNQYIQAGATFAAGPQVVGSTRAADAHGSATIFYEPFEFLLAVDNVHIVTIPVAAKAQVSVTLSSFAFTAYLDESFGPFSFAADVAANVGEKNGKLHWFAGGSGSGCVNVIISACVDVTGGAGPSGVAGCGGITIIPGTWFNDPVKLYGGGVVFWPIPGGGVGTFEGCGIGKIKGKVGSGRIARARTAAAARGASDPTTSLKLPGSMEIALFEIGGDGNRPEVRLRGPKGIDVSTPGPGVDTAEGPGYFISKLTPEDVTYIAIGQPPKGTYKITELPGSPPITGVGLGEGLPANMVNGRVTGKGRSRTLAYRAAKIPGVKVVFVERGGPAEPDEPGESVDEVIGQTRGGKGSLRFTPAEANVRKRRIDAVVVNQGAPFKTELVDRFRAPAFRRLPGANVRANRKGKKLKVRWSRVGGATGYRVIADLGDSPTQSFEREPGKRHLVLRGVSKRDIGRIEVRAISEAGYIGRPGVKRVRRR